MSRHLLLLVALVAGCAPDALLTTLGHDITFKPEVPDLAPAHRSEVLTQRIPEKIDVVWLIDDSLSMLAEQNELADNAAAFLKQYSASGLDWHIGVITTNMRDDDHRGKLQDGSGYRWVDPTVPDPITVFQSMAVVGRDGPNSEQGRDGLYASMNDPEAMAYNEGFYRDDARLSVIIVSDEDDHSDLALDDFLLWISDLKQTTDMVTVAAIIQPDEVCPRADLDGDGDRECDPAPTCECTLNKQGLDYIEVVHATGGIVFDIAEDVWEPALEELGDLGAGLSRVFHLPKLPVVDSIVVWVEDDGRTFDFTMGVDYDYDEVRNAIVFRSYTPRASADVYVDYDVLGQ